MREGVLEGVFTFGKEAGLVEQVGGMELHQATLQALLRCLGNGLQQWKGHCHTKDSSALKQALRLGLQPIDARRQDGLHSRRHLQALESVLQQF